MTTVHLFESFEAFNFGLLLSLNKKNFWYCDNEPEFKELLEGYSWRPDNTFSDRTPGKYLLSLKVTSYSDLLTQIKTKHPELLI